MPLTWDIQKVENWEEVSEGDEWKKTEGIIWSTLLIHLGEITEKNYVEFYTRGTFVHPNVFGETISLSDIKRRVGLHTNVSKKTQIQFARSVFKSQLDYYTRNEEHILNREE